MVTMQGELPRRGAKRSTDSRRVWAGRIISVIPVLFMIVDGATKIVTIKPVVDAFTQLGIPIALAPVIGMVALVCTIVYAIPRTAFLGAVLLTGYLGGAIAIQLRIESPAFPLLFPLIIAAMLWGGLALRDERVLPMLFGKP